MINPTAPAAPDAVSYHPMEMIREWHTAAGTKRFSEQPDAFGRHAELNLRMKLIREEYREAMDELLDIQNNQGSRVKAAKELADVLYVVYSAADYLEIPLEAVLREVHRSNMTKVVNGKVQRRPDGKILKGPNYQEPDIENIVLTSVSD